MGFKLVFLIASPDEQSPSALILDQTTSASRGISSPLSGIVKETRKGVLTGSSSAVIRPNPCALISLVAAVFISSGAMLSLAYFRGIETRKRTNFLF